MSSRKSNRSRHEPVEEDNDAWLFDSIVAFLKSPIWTTPIQQFIENNCSIFSPQDGWSGSALLEDRKTASKEDEPLEFLQVHAKYKKLVDVLINSFIQDIGITYSEFVQACRNNTRFVDHPIYIELFEQIWSADNMDMFKSQMTKKNIELELQALILLQHQLGLHGNPVPPEQEDAIMDIVIRQSKDEYDALMSGRERFSSQSSRLSSTSQSLPLRKQQDLEVAKKIVQNEETQQRLHEELAHQEHLNRRLLKDATSDRPMSARGAAKSRTDADMNTARSNMEKMRISSHHRHDDDDDEDNNDRRHSRHSRRNINDHDDDMDEEMHDYVNARRHVDSSQLVNSLAQNYLSQSGGNVSESELKRRAEFMQKQRELLAEKKRHERERQLDAFLRESESNQNVAYRRPMSSQTARTILSGTDPSKIKTSNSVHSSEDRKLIEARKALAETLKKEVVNNREFHHSDKK